MSLTENATTLSNVSKNAKDFNPPQNGYDIPVLGLAEGYFQYVHILALSCIGISFVFSFAMLFLSFRPPKKSFFKRTKSDRLVVYIAVLDCLFNLFHSMDHLQILITKDHVYPPALCTCYAFMLGVPVSAQMLLVHLVAINVFCMIFLKKDIHFGSFDWKLISVILGIPLVMYLIAVLLGKLGPSGAFCYFDAIRGRDLFLVYNGVVIFYVILANSCLYVATFIKIHLQTKKLSSVLGTDPQRMKRLHRSARTMSLFVAVFFIQWVSLACYSVTSLMGHIPVFMLYFIIIFSNIGGVLNGIAFIMNKRMRTMSSSKTTETMSSSKSSETMSSFKTTEMASSSKTPETMSSSKTTDTVSPEETPNNWIKVDQIKMYIIPCPLTQECLNTDGSLIEGISYRKQT